MSSIVESHPQRSEIERAIIAGQSARAIARWCKPVVSHATINLFRSTMLKHLVSTAAKDIAKQAVTVARRTVPEITAQDCQAFTERRALAEPFIARVAEYDAARDRMFKVAEKKEDARGFAALDSSRLKGIQLQAQLAGALDTTSAVSTTFNVAICLPEQDRPAILDQAGAVIDIDPL